MGMVNPFFSSLFQALISPHMPQSQSSSTSYNFATPFSSYLPQSQLSPSHLLQSPSTSHSFATPFSSHLLQSQSSPSTSHTNFATPQSSLTQISMAEFLQQIDEMEDTGDYYCKFLEGFEKQRIKVRHLCKLSDKQFEACGVTTIGDIETIKDAAKKYK